MMFLLKCPRCGNQMKYQGRDANIIGKRKACVYCNFSMEVRNAIVKEL